MVRMTLGRDRTDEEMENVLRTAYEAFNARDTETAIGLMHPNVDWPNAWKGGRVVGRSAVADYWRRQFESVSSEVKPEAFGHNSDGSITVAVHQVVRDARSGALLADEHIGHRYWVEDDLIVRMNVVELPS